MKQKLVLWAAVLVLALRNLLLHKLRSFLTTLGTVLGVGSVISMLAIGEGSKRESIERIREMGASNVIIRTVKPKEETIPMATGGGPGGQQQQARINEFGLTYRDFERLQATIPHVRYAVPIALNRRNATRGKRRLPNARILGTTPDLFKIKNLKLRRGRILRQEDLDETANVAVVGAGAARQLFSYEDPVGKTLLLGPSAFRIVGVLDGQSSGNAIPGAVGQDDLNNDVYIPITAAQLRIGQLQQVGSNEYEKTQLSEITLAMEDERLVLATAEMCRKLMESSHTKKPDFEIQTPLELLRQAQREKQVWNLVLGSIAGISLLVGGIGIMNIMLATVTERTREIGIRRALGATQTDITTQFLVESTALSAAGGLIGILLGISIPVMVTWTSQIDTAISWWSVLLAFFISLGVGVGFGVYPARRAAMMDPIEALRHQ